ncbi:hypothetical protein [Paenibacillus illinoisensis]|uniref:hypothetical protein n=1 Tax=Paenibacillus illinoisensis TaxID=59845 RepID=UPI001C8E513D|nr:hypothetical protein [Paenibacillus illinoisensis]MBY0217219.1 hypothetical protein [Paenibacillus illinoisensis]
MQNIFLKQKGKGENCRILHIYRGEKEKQLAKWQVNGIGSKEAEGQWGKGEETSEGKKTERAKV